MEEGQEPKNLRGIVVRSGNGRRKQSTAQHSTQHRAHSTQQREEDYCESLI